MFVTQPPTDVLEIGDTRIVPGGRLGAYVYVKRIGTGGMADVVLARDPNEDP